MMRVHKTFKLKILSFWQLSLTTFYYEVELESRAPLPENYTDSPVFYGPDGQIITEEESSFLTANMENYELNIDEIIE